ncbi:hypothetical protein E2I00_010917, partial [Balaenoptera physalus]
EGVRQCLQQQCEQTVRILHAKVAQKSYGNEKRSRMEGEASAGPRSQKIGGDAERTGFCLEREPKSLDVQLHVTSDGADVYTYNTLFDAHPCKGTEDGNLPGKSKGPSQAGALIPPPLTVCISSGSKVSLFNRLRSQTVSTRYLSVEDGDFVASARQWAAFTLHLADEHCSQGDFPPREGYVHYGSLVQLTCTVTGVTLPPMIIRKVAKQCALLDVDEPISQLHKCAFQFPGGPPGGGGTYLCLATEKVVQFQASPCPKEANKALLNDSSCWTIIGTESVEFSFSTSLACTREPVTPVPLISTLELSGGGDVATLELHGENLHAGLKVWFGEVEAETMYRYEEGGNPMGPRERSRLGVGGCVPSVSLQP